LFPEEIEGLEKMTPKQRKNLRLELPAEFKDLASLDSLTPKQRSKIRLELRGGGGGDGTVHNVDVESGGDTGRQKSAAFETLELNAQKISRKRLHVGLRGGDDEEGGGGGGGGGGDGSDTHGIRIQIQYHMNINCTCL